MIFFLQTGILLLGVLEDTLGVLEDNQGSYSTYLDNDKSYIYNSGLGANIRDRMEDVIEDAGDLESIDQRNESPQDYPPYGNAYSKWMTAEQPIISKRDLNGPPPSAVGHPNIHPSQLYSYPHLNPYFTNPHQYPGYTPGPTSPPVYIPPAGPHAPPVYVSPPSPTTPTPVYRYNPTPVPYTTPAPSYIPPVYHTQPLSPTPPAYNSPRISPTPAPYNSPPVYHTPPVYRYSPLAYNTPPPPAPTPAYVPPRVDIQEPVHLGIPPGVDPNHHVPPEVLRAIGFQQSHLLQQNFPQPQHHHVHHDPILLPPTVPNVHHNPTTNHHAINPLHQEPLHPHHGPFQQQTLHTQEGLINNQPFNPPQEPVTLPPTIFREPQPLPVPTFPPHNREGVHHHQPQHQPEHQQQHHPVQGPHQPRVPRIGPSANQVPQSVPDLFSQTAPHNAPNSGPLLTRNPGLMSDQSPIGPQLPPSSQNQIPQQGQPFDKPERPKLPPSSQVLPIPSRPKHTPDPTQTQPLSFNRQPPEAPRSLQEPIKLPQSSKNLDFLQGSFQGGSSPPRESRALQKLLNVAGDNWSPDADIDTNLIQDRKSSNFICPAREGHFPDPHSCDAYFQCDHGVAHRNKCGKGLVWNMRIEQCDWHTNVNCDHNR